MNKPNDWEYEELNRYYKKKEDRFDLIATCVFTGTIILFAGYNLYNGSFLGERRQSNISIEQEINKIEKKVCELEKKYNPKNFEIYCRK